MRMINGEDGREVRAETFGREPRGEINSAQEASSKMHLPIQMKYKSSIHYIQSKLLILLIDLYDYIIFLLKITLASFSIIHIIYVLLKKYFFYLRVIIAAN